jgi:hypothetical protein
VKDQQFFGQTKAGGAMASFVPTSSDEKNGTIDCVWYGGQPVARVDRDTYEPYMLTLDMAGARMDRLNAGAPVFDTHFTGDDCKSIITGKPGTKAQIGVVQKAWADGGKGKATLKFDMGNPDGAEMFRKASTGIVQNLSFGAWIYKREKQQQTGTQAGDDTPSFTATDWEPFEVSPCPVPADFSTQFLTADGLESARAKAVQVERARVTEIRAAAPLELSDEFVKKLIDEGVSVTEARVKMAAEAATIAQAGKQNKETQQMDKEQLDAARAEAVKAERARVQEIHAAAAPFKFKEGFVQGLIDSGATGADAVKKIQAEGTRAADIRAAASPFKSLKEDFVTKLIDGGGSAEDARKAILTELAAVGQQGADGKEFKIYSEVGVSRDGKEVRFAQMQMALLLRANSQFFLGRKVDHAGNPTSEFLAGFGPEVQKRAEDMGREYRGMTLLELAKESLALSGINPRGMSKTEVAQKALAMGRAESFGGAESTGDFPSILANVANKTLRQGYEAYPRTFQPLGKQVTAADFKPINRVQLSDSPALQKLNEKGEFRRANLTDSNQDYSLTTLGEIVAITRKVIINDDLQAFTRVPALLGMAAARSESDIVWAVITGNQVMKEDSTALFHTNHKNVFTGAGSSIDPGVNSTPITAMNSLRKLLRLQIGPQKTPLNLTPRYAVAPAALESFLLQLTYPINIASADSTKVVPEWVRSMVPVIEPRLDAASATQWYGFADPAQIDTIEYCYLEGQEGVYIETRQGFEVDGVEIKARLDFAAAAIDYRGMVRAAGA